MISTLPLTTDTLARFFLAFSQFHSIILITGLGYIFLNKSIFYHAITLALFSILINVALKVTFQVPLSPTLHKAGFAFPSGHMQLSAVYYGVILRHYFSALRSIMLTILLCGIGFGLIHFDYHTLEDVLGALFIAASMVSLHYFSWERLMSITYRRSFFLLTLSTALISYIAWMYHLQAHVWQVYCGLASIETIICFNDKLKLASLLTNKLKKLSH